MHSPHQNRTLPRWARRSGGRASERVEQGTQPRGVPLSPLAAGSLWALRVGLPHLREMWTKPQNSTSPPHSPHRIKPRCSALLLKSGYHNFTAICKRKCPPGGENPTPFGTFPTMEYFRATARKHGPDTQQERKSYTQM